MTDWRQVQARIRKARTSADPPGQLAALYERTHDAMVAFELAQFHEKAGAHAEAARWYTSAAERFRRAQWKQKAVEALARLGAPIPVAATSAAARAEDAPSEPAAEFEAGVAVLSGAQPLETQSEMFRVEPETDAPVKAAPAIAEPSGDATQAVAVKRKRRGRRGGRGRRKGKRPEAGAAPASQPAAAAPARRVVAARPEPRSHFSDDYAAPPPSAPEPSHAQEAASSAAPAASHEMGRGRAGDPALVSRMALLESQLRRLLACSLHPVDSPEDAPAGPGVFLLTDSDQTCYYYVESCQTLRIGIGNLLRTGRGVREGANLKERLADHLGISESRVSKYLKDHCSVRWLQLDEGAPLLAHFAVAVLRPIVNE